MFVGKNKIVNIIGIIFIALAIFTSVSVVANPKIKQLFGLRAKITEYYIPNPPGLTSTGTGDCKRVDNSYCDGERMYELYFWYKNQPDGWWNIQTNGNFTPNDFMAMMLMAEATGGTVDSLRAITEATNNQLYGSNGYCNTPNCEAGIFNFMGAYMMSAGLRYNAIMTNGGNPSAGTVSNLKDPGYANYFIQNGMTLTQVSAIIDNTQDPNANFEDVPTQWGCLDCGDENMKWVGNALKENVRVGTTDECGIYFVGGGDAVYTLEQKRKWEQDSCS